jgi:hypothetical protein
MTAALCTELVVKNEQQAWAHKTISAISCVNEQINEK